MSKVAVVYWSGTGNTKEMAEAVAEGARVQGADVSIIEAGSFSEGDVATYDALAFGCPSMGAEVLEETEFEPMFTAVEGSLSGKRVALFGSWGWGGGAWMTDWEARCASDGITLACDSVTCQDAPDDTALDACRDMGKVLAG